MNTRKYASVLFILRQMQVCSSMFKSYASICVSLYASVLFILLVVLFLFYWLVVVRLIPNLFAYGYIAVPEKYIASNP